jgi:hypothetical protein
MCLFWWVLIVNGLGWVGFIFYCGSKWLIPMGVYGFCMGVGFHGSSLIRIPQDYIRVDSQLSFKSQHTQLNPNSPSLLPCTGGRILLPAPAAGVSPLPMSSPRQTELPWPLLTTDANQTLSNLDADATCPLARALAYEANTLPLQGPFTHCSFLFTSREIYASFGVLL